MHEYFPTTNILLSDLIGCVTPFHTSILRGRNKFKVVQSLCPSTFDFDWSSTIYAWSCVRVRVNKNYTLPFRRTDRPFPFHFLFPSVQHTFDFSACSISLFSPFIFCGKGHSVCVNSRFGEEGIL